MGETQASALGVMFTFLSALTSGSALAPLFQSLYYFQRNAHCLNGPCTPGSFGGGVWHEVSYEWNSPKEANKAVGYGRCPHRWPQRHPQLLERQLPEKNGA